jgi:diaminopimelate epimerase
MTIPFTKMHGLGNDFVMINANHAKAIKDFNVFAKTVANRRLGIGCDQLVFFTELSLSHYLMSIYNADGSLAEACGNATRCLALLIGENTGQNNPICIEVENRKLICVLEKSGIVSVNMGAAYFDKDWMPSQTALWELSNTYKLNPRELVCVDVGNPHLIIFHDALSESEMDFLGKKFATHELFSKGVNVNFVNIIESNIHLTVWERGVGLSLACGSGACASFAASCKLGFVEDGKALVLLTLGNLQMKLEGNDIIMKGSATKIATGEYIFQD